MSKCNICPRECNANRVGEASNNKGYCRIGALPVISRAALHYWEEPCISGTKGSGTVFFTGCNLKCVYCQNYKISHCNSGVKITVQKLKDVIQSLIDKGAHNINLVNPTHQVMAIKACLSLFDEISVPIVYNTSSYEKVETLNMVKDYISVFLPDLKYMNSDLSEKYSGAKDYFNVASKAISKMYDFVGGVTLDNNGIIEKGMIIRHLILPGCTQDSMNILKWISENLPNDIGISIMSQYTPYGEAPNYKELNRKITTYEYKKVVNYAINLGLNNVYIQDKSSSDEAYIPDFNLDS